MLHMIVRGDCTCVTERLYVVVVVVGGGGVGVFIVCCCCRCIYLF